MKIVVVDGATLNPGDLSWELLGECGDYEVYPRSSREELLHRGRDAEAIITNKVAIDEAAMKSLPRLKYIGVTATGYNVIDVSAADARGIVVTNVPTYGTDSVAQMVLALLLELTQHVGHHAETVRQGRWATCPNFCYWDYPLVELAGLTMGIVGCGRIGRAVARLARAFGMNVLGYDVVGMAAPAAEIEPASLDRLFAESDVVSLHCPLTPENQGFVHARRLAQMKPGAFLINTSRGPLINDRDLAAALNSGRLAGAGLDVLSVEPPPLDNPLLTAKNCLITPHIAWATRSARQRLMNTVMENLRAFTQGQPQNVVNKPRK
jgi:glycerate dehydrogenase